MELHRCFDILLSIDKLKCIWYAFMSWCNLQHHCSCKIFPCPFQMSVSTQKCYFLSLKCLPLTILTICAEFSCFDFPLLKEGLSVRKQNYEPLGHITHSIILSYPLQIHQCYQGTGGNLSVIVSMAVYASLMLAHVVL